MSDLRTSTDSTVFSHAELQKRVDIQPRISLAALPTPLDFCPRLSKFLGGPDIYIKRDDLTGLAFGGNKTRQLEFLLPKVFHEDFDILVAGAYTQSNWCRQITAAARKLDLEVMLVLVHGEKGPIRQGNLLLDELMGAEIRIVDIPDIQDSPGTYSRTPVHEPCTSYVPTIEKIPLYLGSPFHCPTQRTHAHRQSVHSMEYSL